MTCILSDAIGDQVSSLFWEILATGTREVLGHPSPIAAINLLRISLQCGDDLHMQRLDEAILAIEEAFGANQDLHVTQQATTRIADALDKLVAVALAGDFSEEVVRAAAELNRDVLGRVYTAVGAEASVIIKSNAEVAALLNADRPIAVMEWIGSRKSVRILLTSIALTGCPVSRIIVPPPVDLEAVRDEVRWKVGNWHPGEQDPLDIEQLQLVERWLHELVSSALPDGGHLVVIEHPDCPGFPWQAVTRSRWTVSSVPSWSALQRASLAKSKTRIFGLVIVPKHGEHSKNVEAFETSRSSTLRLCQQFGLPSVEASNHDADAGAVRLLLEKVSIAKLICHGCVDTATKTVAWQVANGGDLPLAHSHASVSKRGRQHWLRWQDCQRLAASPQFVFSCACSSGFSYSGGRGERLSLFSTLRGHGTRAVVAPLWDLIPSTALPLLDDVIERHIRGEDLALAVLHASAAAAENGAPPWVAWAFAIEGHWQ
jgi:hypothetical protein